MTVPRLLISAPQGRSGKSIISIGLCAILRGQGLTVQPFKKGPDYIDPSWLSAAAGLPCRNIDSFLVPEERLVAYFSKSCLGADIAIVEGVMGLYDSVYPDGKTSSADIARLLGIPVIFIINTSRMTRSVAAMINGYQKFESDLSLAGVILNNITGKRHETNLRRAIDDYCGIPVFGAVPNDDNLNISQRHLGLVPFEEDSSAIDTIEQIQDLLKKHLDIEGLLNIARSARPLPETTNLNTVALERNIKIGVIRDRVFNFYYTENLEALRVNGAELVFIDSLTDKKLPEIHGLYIGGGFPELFLEELEANASLRHHINEMVNSGLPVYAECAGLMYLCRGIRQKHRFYHMAAIITAEVELYNKPQGHGYTVVEVSRENPWFNAGTIIKGHEFHYSKLNECSGLTFAFSVKQGHGISGKVDGIFYNNVLASYMHINALSTPEWSEAFTSLAFKFATKKDLVPLR